MEMSNLPQYTMAWGDKENKERAPMRYMAAIVWCFMKHKMCGIAPNIGNVADSFKVSRSLLSTLIMAKKFRSGLGGYVPKKRRVTVEGEASGSAVKLATGQEQEEDKFEQYLVH